MRKINTLIILLVISFCTFLFFSKNNGSKPLEPEQGDKDNPYGASKYRFDMISGKLGYIDPRSRQNAIDYTINKLQPNKLMKTKGITAWTPLGPGNIGGRIRAIIVRPSNTSNILAGSVAGGVWKSTDGGASWNPKLDNGAQLSISCMVKDPSNENIIYAGTGEGWTNLDAVYGGGIYKSTDFGDTWTLLPSTLTVPFNFKNVRSMAIDPSGNLYAVTFAYNIKDGVGSFITNGGLYKSTDGGTSFATINSTNFATNYFNGYDVVPFTASNIIFATGSNGATLGGIYRTTNGGTTWTQITANLPSANYSRIAFAKDPNNANTAYAQFESKSYVSPDFGLAGIFKTIDAGATWTALTRPDTLYSTGGLSFLSKQGWYDNVIAVDPFNSNNLYVGGVDMMKSTNSGNSWFQLTYWDPFFGTPSIHADHHAIVFDPVTANVVYCGDDGGIQKTINGGTTWTVLNNNLQITQFYGGAVSPTGATYSGGTQDNGHLKFSSGTNWNEVFGGDGGYAAQDQTNALVSYEEYVYLQMSKTTDGGTTWNSCTSGLTDVNTTNCLFISPFAMDPQNSAVLVAGSNKVWITTNSAGNWTQVSNALTAGHVSAVIIADASTTFLGFAGTTDGHVFKCVSLDPTLGINTWTDISPTGNNAAYVRRISIDPSNQQNIYACYSGYNNNGVSPSKHVWFSSNQGTSWTDVSGDLPDVPVHSLLVDNAIPTTLYIGTETGVYQSTNRGTNWTSATSGMPAFAPVDELVYQSGTSSIFAFTHGRSAFMTVSPTPVELSSFSAIINGNSIKLNWITATERNNYGFDVERALVDNSNNNTISFNKIGFIQGHGLSNSPKEYKYSDNSVLSGKKYSFRLKQIDNDGTITYSKIISIETGNMPIEFTLNQNYPNPFNPSTVIKYLIPGDGNVKLSIYNAKGELVKKVVDQFQKEGSYNFTFNGAGLASGIYFYKIDAGKFSQTKKMILLK